MVSRPLVIRLSALQICRVISVHLALPANDVKNCLLQYVLTRGDWNYIRIKIHKFLLRHSSSKHQGNESRVVQVQYTHRTFDNSERASVLNVEELGVS